MVYFYNLIYKTIQNYSRSIVLVVFFMALGSFTAWGQTALTAYWHMNNAEQLTVTQGANTDAVGATAIIGSALSAAKYDANGINFTPRAWPTNLAAAQADNTYMEFSLTVAAGKEMSLTGLTVAKAESNGSGSTTWQVRYSIDGGAYADYGGTITGTGSKAVTLGSAISVGSGSTITFRVYIYGNATTSRSVRMEDFKPIGTTTTSSCTAPTASFATSPVSGTVGDNNTQTVTTNSDGAVSYSSSNATVAPVNAATGAVSFNSAGTAIITASIAATATYCAATATYTVNVAEVTLPACTTPSITANIGSGNNQNICSGAVPASGFSITATNATSYQWYSNTTASTTGGTLISGATSAALPAGSIDKTQTKYYYCVVTNSTPGTCSAATATSGIAQVSVSNPTIAGGTSVNVGGTLQLSTGTGGGTWSVTNGASFASVSATGLVSGLAAGTATVSYTVNGCTDTHDVTVQVGQICKYFPAGGNKNQHDFGEAILYFAKANMTTYADTTIAGTTTSNVCPPAAIRFNPFAVVVYLEDVGASEILLYGQQGQAVNITNVYTADALNGPYTPLGGYTAVNYRGNPSGTYNQCSYLGITGVNIPQGKYVFIPYSYQFRISGLCITPIVCTPPTISGGQTSVCVNGTTTAFTASAAGTWTTSDANLATIDVGGVVTAKAVAGTVDIIFTETGNENCPARQTLTIVGAPTITTQPAAESIYGQNQAASALTVVASGSSVSYQWYSNTTNSNTGGTSIGTATSDSYTPPTNVATGDYYYYVVVTACGQSTTSSVAKVTIIPPCTVSDPAGAVSVTANCDATFTVSHSGASASGTDVWYWQTSATGTDMTYPVSGNYVVLAGATLPLTLYVRSFNSNSGQGAGCWSTHTVNSGSITIAQRQGIIITTQPVGASYSIGDTPSGMTVAATGNGILSYQWYVNTVNSNTGGQAIAGATGAALNPSAIDTSVEGTTYYYVKVSSDDATCPLPVYSDAAAVTVTPCTTNCPYNYQCESFESGWVSNRNPEAVQNVSTGAWKLAYGDIVSSPARGSYALKRYNNNFKLTSPTLTMGVSTVTVYAHPNTSSARTMTLEAFNAGGTRLFTKVEPIHTNGWAQYTFTINDADVAYITITTSDNSVHFDDICINPIPCEVAPSSAGLINLGYMVGETPTAQSFDINYENLPAANKKITITPPANFEVLVPGGTPSGWSLSPVTYTPSAVTGTLAGVRVRLAVGLSANDYSGNVTIKTSAVVCSDVVAVSGTVFDVGTCFITSPAEVTGLDYEEGDASPEKWITISWHNLPTDILTISPPENFEISVGGMEWTSGAVQYQCESVEEQEQGSLQIEIRLMEGLGINTYAGPLTFTADVTCTSSTNISGQVLEEYVPPINCFPDGADITTNWPLTANNNPTVGSDDIIGGSATVGSRITATGNDATSGVKMQIQNNWPTAPILEEGYYLNIPFLVAEGKNATIESVSCTVDGKSGGADLTANSGYILMYSIDGGDWTQFGTKQRGQTKNGQPVTITFTGATPLLLSSEDNVRFRLFPVEQGSSSRHIYVKDVLLNGKTCDEQRAPAELAVSPDVLTGFSSDGCDDSNPQSFTVTGAFLRPVVGEIAMTGADDYEFSLSSDFSSIITSIPYSGGVLNRVVYVRLKSGRLTGTYNNTLTLSGGGYKDTPPVEVSLSGSSTGTISMSATPLLTGPNFQYGDQTEDPHSNALDGSISWNGMSVGDVIDLTVQHGNFEFSFTGDWGIIYYPNTTYTLTAGDVPNGSKTIYYRMKGGLPVGNYADTLVASYGCYTAKQALAGKVTSDSECAFTTSVELVNDATIITGLDYGQGEGPSAGRAIQVYITNFPVGTNPAYTMSGNRDFEYSFDGNTWTRPGGSASFSQLQGQGTGTRTVTMYFRLRGGLAVGTYSNTLSIKPANCEGIDIVLEGSVRDLPKITIKNDEGREVGVVCENAAEGNESITLSTNATATTYIWEYRNANVAGGAWQTLPQNTKTIALSPPSGITTYRVTANGVSSAETVFRTMVCCAVVGNFELVFADDFGTVSGDNRNTSPYVTGSYTYAGSGEIKDGTYAIVNNARAGGSNTYWQNIGDHTENTDGAMLVVNGSAPGQVAYRRDYQTVLCPNTLYNFSAWVRNLHASNDGNRPNLVFYIKDQMGNILEEMSTGDIAIADGWVEYGVTFNSGDYGGQNIRLEIVSNKAAGGGNDYALDDITFTSCAPETYLTIDGLRSIDYVLCEGDRILNMQSECEYDIKQFYPNVAYGFLYRAIETGDTEPYTQYHNWTLAEWPEDDDKYPFDTSPLEAGQTYSFMSITANDPSIVKEVCDFYTNGTEFTLQECEKYSLSTVSKVRKPFIPELTVALQGNVTICKSDINEVITITIEDEDASTPLDLLAKGRLVVNEVEIPETPGALPAVIDGLHIESVVVSGTNNSKVTITIHSSPSDLGEFDVSYLLAGDAGDVDQNICDEFAYSQHISIEEATAPVVVIAADKEAVCANTGGVDFSITSINGVTEFDAANYTYQWYVNDVAAEDETGTTFAAADIADQDEVYVEVMPKGGCAAATGNSNTIVISVENPSVSIATNLAGNGTTLDCVNSQVTLTATPSIIGGTWLWTHDANETTAVATVDYAGTFSVQYKTLNNCPAVGTITIDTLIHAKPVLTITPPAEECEPNTIDIADGTIVGKVVDSHDISLVLQGNYAIFTYWTDAQATVSLGNTVIGRANVDAGTNKAIYYIKTNANVCGEFDVKPVEVTINPKPVTSEIECTTE